jgi:flagella basal body P-ring formation protein FlgA
MRLSARIPVFVFFVAALCGIAMPCAAVTLRTATEVDRATVKLSDVFEGLPDGVDCDVARAPAPGKSITYDSTVLANLAKQYSLDWQPQSLADHTTITTAGTKITAEDIRSYVIDKIKALDVKGDISIMFDNRVLEVTVPSDQLPDLVLDNFEYEPVNKRFHADLMIDGFAGPADLTITGHVIIHKNVPVLAKRLEAGTIIGPSDIDWLSVDEDRAAGVVLDANKLVGHELQRDTDAGQLLREHDVIPPRLVVRGQLVTMKIETPFMTVTAQGRALQDGKLGDVVRVSNTQSNRMIEGTVESAGVVRISTTQRLASANAEEKQE